MDYVDSKLMNKSYAHMIHSYYNPTVKKLIIIIIIIIIIMIIIIMINDK